MVDADPKPDNQTVPPLRITAKLNGVPIALEVDTGAAFTICSRRTFTTFADAEGVRPTTLVLRDYSGTPIPLVGQADVPVEYGDVRTVLPVVIATEDRATLLGRNWLSPLGLRISADAPLAVHKTEEDVAAAQPTSQEYANAYAGKFPCFDRALAGIKAAL